MRVPPVRINTKNADADEVVTFAETLEGIRYKYGSTDPKNGFDCSGFVWYVFNRFNIKVPRTSGDFTNAGKEVSIRDSRRGDLILFTGSDPNSGVVGHMGIITQNRNNRILFIHASSGGGKGVMVSGMNEYFIPRFVKVIRVFNSIKD
jgi:cell wall-associated NlpC family hydrolase